MLPDKYAEHVVIYWVWKPLLREIYYSVLRLDSRLKLADKVSAWVRFIPTH